LRKTKWLKQEKIQEISVQGHHLPLLFYLLGKKLFQAADQAS
jgi:hypothetical protein